MGYSDALEAMRDVCSYAVNSSVWERSACILSELCIKTLSFL